jgi:SlyX protein
MGTFTILLSHSPGSLNMQPATPECDSKMVNVPISNSRLNAIEEKLAHLESAVQELSDVVARQQKELDLALQRNQRLLDKIAAMESDFGPSATAHEKPPHY